MKVSLLALFSLLIGSAFAYAANAIVFIKGPMTASRDFTYQNYPGPLPPPGNGTLTGTVVVQFVSPNAGAGNLSSLSGTCTLHWYGSWIPTGGNISDSVSKGSSDITMNSGNPETLEMCMDDMDTFNPLYY
jgi:hypothetical protein